MTVNLLPVRVELQRKNDNREKKEESVNGNKCYLGVLSPYPPPLGQHVCRVLDCEPSLWSNSILATARENPRAPPILHYVRMSCRHSMRDCSITLSLTLQFC